MLRDWKRRIARVAIDEMLHLAQVTDMLAAVGSAPHFQRTYVPLDARQLSVRYRTLNRSERCRCGGLSEPMRRGKTMTVGRTFAIER